MAADRGAYIDQSQSLNIHIADPNFGKLTSMHFYAWKKGLKTGMYYLRSKAAADAIKFTVDKTALKEPSLVESEENSEAPTGTQAKVKQTVSITEEQKQADMSCSLENPDDCISCGS